MQDSVANVGEESNIRHNETQHRQYRREMFYLKMEQIVHNTGNIEGKYFSKFFSFVSHKIHNSDNTPIFPVLVIYEGNLMSCKIAKYSWVCAFNAAQSER